MVKKDSYFELQHNRTLKILFFILFGAVIAGLVFIFRYFFWPFLFALLLYMALQPVFNFIMTYVKKRGAGAGAMIILLFCVVFVPLFFIMVAVIDQIYQLYTFVQSEIKAGAIEDIYHSELVQRILSYLNIETSDITSRATDFIQNISGTLLASAQAMIAYPLNLILNFFFLLLILFFLFKDGGALGSVFYKTMPFPDDLEEKVVNRLKEVVRVLLTGNLLIMIVQGFMVGLGLFIVGMRLAFLGGSLAAILSLIPVIGTSLIWVPAVIYLIVTGAYLKALFLGVWCLAWYLLLENLVKPKVFGKKLNFHPVVFFFLLLGSIQAFGLPGVFIGPLILTLFYSLWEIYRMLEEYDMHHYSTAKKRGL
jgi:predicted PurR-regulated permease PerM